MLGLNYILALKVNQQASNIKFQTFIPHHQAENVNYSQFFQQGTKSEW